MKRYNLIELREKRGLTREQLADKLEISTVFVGKIESGSADPGRKTSLKFESFYQIPERTLFPDLFNDKNFIKNDSDVQ